MAAASDDSDSDDEMILIGGRVFRDRSNPFEDTDDVFRANYRLTKQGAIRIIDLLAGWLLPTKPNIPTVVSASFFYA